MPAPQALEIVLQMEMRRSPDSCNLARKPTEDLVADGQSVRLVKALHSAKTVAIVISPICGVGIVILTGTAAARIAGLPIVLLFILAAMA